MPRLSMNEMTTYRWSFEEDVARYTAAGIGAIGVWRQKLSDFGEDKGVELLAESGLQVSNLLWAGGFTGSDGRSLRDSIDDALEAVRLAAEMKAGCLIVYSGARAGHTHGHARRLVRDALAQVLPLAAELHVTLAIEPMHPECAQDWTFLTCLKDTLDLVGTVNSPQLKLAFDTYHLGWDSTIFDRLGEITPQIAIVHLGDGQRPRDRDQNRCRLGSGSIPLKELVTALETGGYRGYYDVELIGEEIEATDYQDLLTQSKQAFAELLPA